MAKSRNRFDIVVVWPDGCRSQLTSRNDVDLTIDDVANELDSVVKRIRAYRRREAARLASEE
jgi:hypothetical protein